MNRFVALSALIVPLLGCASCLVVGWPLLPPATYHGLVVDQHNRPVAGAEVTLYRPGKLYARSPIGIYLEFPGEEIAKTHTARDGKFVLATPGGYATAAAVVVGDHELTGYVGTADEAGEPALPKELLIKVQ